MSNSLIIKKKIKNFSKSITVSGDKSISIRWILFSSLANGVSKAKNLLKSEDVLAAVSAIRKLGIKVKFIKNECKVYGKGLEGYQYKKDITIDAKNSGTLGRLILGLLINNTKKIKLVGDSSLSKRDFKRVSDPLSKFGAKFKLYKNRCLPLVMSGSLNLKPIKYIENKGSAQCKSAVILAGLRTKGITKIKAKKSRNHTELFCKHLRLPVTVKSKKNYDEIQVDKMNNLNTINYNIPADISSSAFFIALTALKDNSELTVKNVNINPSRIGIITILKKWVLKYYLKIKKFIKVKQLRMSKLKVLSILNL